LHDAVPLHSKSEYHLFTAIGIHPYRTVIESFLLAPACLPQTEGAMISTTLHGPRDLPISMAQHAKTIVLESDEAEASSLDQTPMRMNAYAMQMQERM
jgi:hypothetical protein